MTTDPQTLWKRFQKYYKHFPSIGLSIDISRMHFDDVFLQGMEGRMQRAFQAMEELERGAIANPDENRMVGHYWLRNPALSPTESIRSEIESNIASIEAFASDVHSGKIQGVHGRFKHLLIIGIGGSALGPQFISDSLGSPADDEMTLHFFDNTDPDGFDKVLSTLETLPDGRLGQTLTLVISKSGGTKETRNGMIEAMAAYNRAGIDFSKHAVAITGNGSALEMAAVNDHWMSVFPMWDWVGGRTSVFSAVGLVPAALQGIDIRQLIRGAEACDLVTRERETISNPAASLALMWFHSGSGKGTKAMVVLPYKDRLILFSRFLQQLVMESLGKTLDLDGKPAYQGLSVFGNKGSTDQHAYIQQLRDGIDNFFVTFVGVSKDRATATVYVEDQWITSGDYLHGLMEGTKTALFENGRGSITIRIDEVSPFHVGVLISLYERAVGLYAQLINVNAYHQPGVEAGKSAANRVLESQRAAVDCLMRRAGHSMTIEDLAMECQMVDRAETLFAVCEHLAANGRMVKTPGEGIFDARYALPSGGESSL